MRFIKKLITRTRSSVLIIIALTLQTQDAPVFPKDLIAQLPTVDMLSSNGFQFPSNMEMNSLEQACLIKDRGYIPRETAMTFSGEIVQYMESQQQDGRTFCILKVEDEIQEVLVPTS